MRGPVHATPNGNIQPETWTVHTAQHMESIRLYISHLPDARGHDSSLYARPAGPCIHVYIKRSQAHDTHDTSVRHRLQMATPPPLQARMQRTSHESHESCWHLDHEPGAGGFIKLKPHQRQHRSARTPARAHTPQHPWPAEATTAAMTYGPLRLPSASPGA